MSEPSASESIPSAKRPVSVLVEPHPAVSDDDFRLCPLGLQFYSAHAVDPFTVLAVDIEAPDAGGRLQKIHCTGVVVRCQPEKGGSRFRVWIQFLDLPDGTRERLRCTAIEGRLLCSYCQNF